MAIDTQQKRQLVLRGYSGILADPPGGAVTIINQIQWANLGADLFNGTFNFMPVKKFGFFKFRARE
jgi:hypothetical protein